ncbi:MAG: PQQ-binding-like beta-propeller repeat protein [Pirellulales bacterium]
MSFDSVTSRREWVSRSSRWLAGGVVGGGILDATLAQSPAADWWRFRGPNGSAVVAEKIPESWGDEKNLAWRAELPGPGSSSPIVVGDKIFVTCYTGYGTNTERGAAENLTRHLLCLSLKDGQILWNKSISGGSTEDGYSGFLREHGYATSTPVADGQRVFVFYGKAGVIAYDLNGQQLWQASVGTGSAANRWGSGASPIIYQDLVIVNAAAESKAIVALDAATGKQVWKSPADNIYQSWSTPVLVDLPDGGVEMVLSAPYELWGFDPATGKFLWYADAIEDQTICGSVVAREGVVYAVGGRGGSAVAVKCGGKDDVSKTHTLWKGSLSAYVPSPVLAGERIFCVSERGILGCLNVKDGKQVFQSRLRDAGGIYASPAVFGDRLLIVTRRNGTLVLDAHGSGEILTTNKFTDDSDFNASPVVADGRLLLRSNKALYCVAGG